MLQRTFGEVIDGVSEDGTELHSPVFDEHQVRAAAGITMALGAVAFAYANFEHVFWPLRLVTAFFFVEFLLRITFGLRYSPAGVAARWMTQRQAPQWVSAKPKRFAWSIGLAMSGVMTVLTNVGVRGMLPRVICLVCLTLMWLESVLGLCLGCELHGFLVRRGWTTKDEAFEVCAHGACAFVPGQRPTGT